MKNKIVLFDMDGTLTEPRQKFDCKELENALYSLTNKGIHIGIITGSDENYLREQMGDFLDKSSCRYKMHLMPCNGTKYFKPPEFATQDFVKTHQVSMKDHLGTEKYFQLIRELIISQLDISLYDIPLTGHFINCRGSIINWCPIGRNANKEERDFFIKADKENNIRKVVLEELRDMFIIKKLSSDISIKLGGDTSFDIYPTGWDKTYGLTHFQDWDVWFVGDRCEENGNDFEIYEACKGRSFISNGPETTIQIINEINKKVS